MSGSVVGTSPSGSVALLITGEPNQRWARCHVGRSSHHGWSSDSLCHDLLPRVVDLQCGGGCRLPGCPSRRASSSDRPAGRSTSRLCRVSTSPLSAEALRARLVAPHGPYAALDVVPSTGSTNSDLAEAARTGAADRTVLIAEEQTAGRGRLQRNWASAPGAGLYLSVLLRPAGVPTGRLGWLPLLAGVALVRLARNTAGVPAVVKWPNDLL